MAHCDSLTTSVYEMYDDARADSRTTLHAITEEAEAAEVCYGQRREARRLWLRRVRLWALEGLKRYREAARLTEAAVSGVLYEAGDSLARVNLLLSLIRYRSFGGDFEGAVEVLDRVRPLATVLAYDRRLHLRLSEASLQLDRGNARRARSIADRVVQQLQAAVAADAGGASADDLAFVEARARLIRAEAQMEQGDGPGAVEDLERSAEAYRRLGMLDRLSVALADLGEAHAMAGQPALSEARTEEAFRVAAADSNAKSMIFACLRRGRIRAAKKGYAMARRDFERGLSLADSSGIHRYTFDLEYELAWLDERQRSLALASRRYAALTRREAYFEPGGVRAVALRGKAEARAAVVESALLRRERNVFAGVFLLALLAAAFGLAVAVRRGKQLNDERWRQELIRQLNEGALLRYLEKILTNPGRTAAQIKTRDAPLARRLRRGRLRGVMDLYQCVSELVFAVQEEDISPNAVRLRLRRMCDRKEWNWPTSLEAWRAHFEEHPLG